MLLRNLLKKLARSTDIVSGFLVLAMMVHISADVAGRYLFNSPIPLTIEIVSNYYMVALVFLPLASTELRDQHIYVEIIYERLGKQGQRIVLAFVHAVSAVAFATTAVRTWGAALRSWSVGEYTMGAYSIIVWPSRFIVPIGCALLTLVLLAKLFGLIEDTSVSSSKEVINADD